MYSLFFQTSILVSTHVLTLLQDINLNIKVIWVVFYLIKKSMIHLVYSTSLTSKRHLGMELHNPFSSMFLLPLGNSVSVYCSLFNNCIAIKYLLLAAYIHLVFASWMGHGKKATLFVIVDTVTLCQS